MLDIRDFVLYILVQGLNIAVTTKDGYNEPERINQQSI